MDDQEGGNESGVRTTESETRSEWRLYDGESRAFPRNERGRAVATAP